MTLFSQESRVPGRQSVRKRNPSTDRNNDRYVNQEVYDTENRHGSQEVDRSNEYSKGE